MSFSNCGEDAFCTQNFCDWKKCYEKLKKHDLSHFHSEAVMKVKFHENAEVDIGSMLDHQLKATQEIRRSSLLKQLSSMRYLARQGLGLRDHDEDNGNLIQLLKTRAEDVPYLEQWLNDRKYLSHDIVNELYELMANTVLRGILNDVRQTRLYSIIADESRDASNKEQMTCVLRWLTDDMQIQEDFVGMYQLSKTDAESITSAIKDILIRCNMDSSNCRWQGYDGAATMSGALQGVAARLNAECPSALYLHCANHCLDLALQGSSKHNVYVRNTIDFVQELSVFIKSSPKRMEEYKQIAKNYEESENIHMLCPTRWTIRTRSLSAVINSYKAIYDTLASIASDRNNKREIRDKANGLLNKMKQFESFFGLMVSKIIFRVCESVATTLQSPTITPQTTVHCIKALLETLQTQRDQFGVVFDNIKENATKIEVIEPPRLPRQRKVPKHLQHGDADSHIFTDVTDYFRVAYCEIIDSVKGEIDHRFNQPSYKILAGIESTILDAANNKCGAFNQVTDLIKDLYSGDVDFCKLESELLLLGGFMKQALPGVKVVTSTDTVVSMFEKDPTSSTMLANIKKLLHIYLLAPMSVASGERTFSVQRRLKSYLRAMMTEKRYNNLLILRVHKHKTDELNLTDIAKEFVNRNERRINLFGKFK